MNDHIRLAWAFLAVGIALVTGFVVRAWLIGGVDTRGQVLAVASAICLLSYAWLDRRGVEAAARSRSVQLGGGAVVLVTIAGAAAVATYSVARSFDSWHDLSWRGGGELSPHAAGVAAALTDDVRIVGFFRHGSPASRSFRRLADRFASASDHLEVVVVDPLRQPVLARDYGVTSEAGSVLVERGDRREALGGRYDEVALTNALARIASETDHVVCWSMGHGEAEVDADSKADAMSAAVLALEGQNYQVRPVTMLSGVVPGDCEVLVVARPTVDWLGFERDALAAWILGGGQALLMLEPGLAPRFTDDLARFGVAVRPEVVLDPAPVRRMMGVTDPSFQLVSRDDWVSHPVSDSLAGAVSLGIALPVTALADTPGMATRGLLFSTEQAWAESGTRLAEAVPDPEELRGPIGLVAVAEVVAPREVGSPPAPVGLEQAEVQERVLGVLAALSGRSRADVDLDVSLATLGLDAAAAAEVRLALAYELGIEPPVRVGMTGMELVAVALQASLARVEAASSLSGEGDARPEPAAGGRLLVIGDATFLSNRFVDFGSNQELFLNAVAWLVSEDAQLAQRPELADEVLEISAAEEALLGVLAIFGVPGFFAMLALRARLRRRRL